jgi:hypothetical protein
MDTLFFDIQHISKTEKERGLESFEVVQITDPFNMPSNIYPCMETDPIKAQQEAYWAMHMPEHNYNVALHFGLAKSISHSNLKTITEALLELPEAFQGMKMSGQFKNNKGSFSNTIRPYLAQTGHNFSANDDLWIDYADHVMKAYALSFPNAKSIYSYFGHSNDHRRNGQARLLTHVHQSNSFTFNRAAYSAQNVSILKLDPNNNTLLADNRDIEAASGTLGYQYNKSHVRLYEAPPLVPLTFKTADLADQLTVHCPMVNKDNIDMKRTVWGVVTDYNEASMAAAHAEQYDAVVEHIRAQDFHQRHLKLGQP